MERKTIIAGNWKMYMTGSQAVEYIHALAPLVASSNPDVYLAVSHCAIYQAALAAKKHHIYIGAQNIFYEEEGAYTGEISSFMLKDAGAEFVLIGHSERRQFFHEDDTIVNKKFLRAIQSDILPILCIGETLQEHKENRAHEVLQKQIERGLHNIPEGYTKFVLAYEPVWAIGTGVSAKPEIAQKAHRCCRDVLTSFFGKKNAQKISILYGGSVKPENISTLMQQEDIDGALVGGASLNYGSFSKIINY